MKKKRNSDDSKALIDSLYDFIDELVMDNEMLMQENKELRFERDSLILENKNLQQMSERYHDAAVLIARRANKLKEDNIKLQVRLDYLGKRGVSRDDVSE